MKLVEGHRPNSWHLIITSFSKRSHGTDQKDLMLLGDMLSERIDELQVEQIEDEYERQMYK